MRILEQYIVPTSAVYNVDDNELFGSRTLEDMTVYYAIGDGSTQMNFDASLYELKTGNDFTSYFPELYAYKSFDNDIFKQDSLKSITHKKLDGEGTQASPYLIYDGFDMMTIHEYVKNGNEFSNKHFKVADGIKHIDLTEPGLDYIPIGTEIYSFGGMFNGNKATFYIHLDSFENYQGIFHTLDETANIFDLTINGYIRGRGYVGSLAGRNLGRV